MNNGTCIEGIGTAVTCNCVHGFSGMLCEEDIDYCEIFDCFNSGNCTDGGIDVDFTCTCAPGFSGSQCQIA